MLKRDLYQSLIQWKNDKNRRPLLLRGARQVGKTFIVKHLGNQEFSNFITLNLERNPEYKEIFNSLLPQEIIERNYWHQALMGDSTDGIKGAKGVGDVKAAKLVDSPWFDWDTYCMQFASHEEAVLSMQLVRLDQYKKGELELWTNTKTQ